MPAVVAGLGALAAGCGMELKDRLVAVHQTIKDARENGAYKCAPRELAMAETHAEFTDDELYYGDYVAAKREIEVASANAKLAYDRSPKDRCAPRVAIIEAPKPKAASKVVIKATDTDGDGVLDKDDKCVDVPGPVENQGCPWPDTDGDGLLDKDDKCPKVPGPKENQGCPWPDTDGDGAIDKDDPCPTEPGPPENKYCPDKDRDGDTVVDRLDKCPDTPGDPKNDGCPVYKLIVVKDNKIELKQKVHFATDKSKIYPDSFAMLNEIADVLTKNAQIEIRIEGHTDSRASRRHNMKLSDARANAVRKYLMGRGVDGSHLGAIGYGPDKPIDDNRTAVGREANRRVEFYITKQ